MKHDLYSRFHGKIHHEKIVPKLVELWREDVKKHGISRVREHVRAEKMSVLDLFTGEMNDRIKPLPSEWKSIMEISCRAPQCPFPYNIDPAESGGCFQCFVAGTPILMYDNSIKLIEKIKVGDYVVSLDEKKFNLKKEKNKYEFDLVKGKVIVTSKAERNVVRLETKSGKSFVCTPEHPFYTEMGWKKAGNLRKGSKIFVLDPYLLKVRERMLKENPMWTPEIAERMKKTRNERIASGEIVPHSPSEEAIERSSKRMKKDNPMYNPEVVKEVKKTRKERGRDEEQSERMRKRWLTDEKYRKAVIETAIKKSSRGQRLLYSYLDELGVGYEPNYYLPNPEKDFGFSMDTAILISKKNIEYDGHSSHYSEEGRRKDQRRDSRLKELGWSVLRIGRKEIYNQNVVKKIQGFLLDDWDEVVSVETLEKSETVYNMQVEGPFGTDAHNYFADLALVHNCIYCFSLLTKSSLYSAWFDGDPWKSRYPRKGYIKEFLTDVLNARGVEPKERATLKSKPKYSGTVGDVKALKKASAQRIPLRMGNRSEPFFHPEKQHKSALEALEVLNEFDYPLIINTKGDLLLEEPWFSKICNLSKVAVQVSIIHNDDAEAKRLEPGAPSSTRRWEVIKTLNDVGVTALPRLEPIMAFINADDEHLEAYAEKAKECGVKYCLMDSYSYTTRSSEIVKAFTEVDYDFERMFKATSEFTILGSYLIQKASYYLKKRGIKTSTFDFNTIPYNDTETCCSIDPIFGNWYNYNTYTATNLIIKLGKLGFTEFDEMFYGEELTAGIRQRVKDVWNLEVADPWAPAYAEGVYVKGRDEGGNIIYGFDKSKLGEGYRNLISIFEGD